MMGDAELFTVRQLLAATADDVQVELWDEICDRQYFGHAGAFKDVKLGQRMVWEVSVKTDGNGNWYMSVWMD